MHGSVWHYLDSEGLFFQGTLGRCPHPTTGSIVGLIGWSPTRCSREEPTESDEGRSMESGSLKQLVSDSVF